MKNKLSETSDFYISRQFRSNYRRMNQSPCMLEYDEQYGNPDAIFQLYVFYNEIQTRMHFSRMRTIRCSCRPPGGGSAQEGVSAQGGVCLPGEGCVCLPGGCLPATPTPLWTE